MKGRIQEVLLSTIQAGVLATLALFAFGSTVADAETLFFIRLEGADGGSVSGSFNVQVPPGPDVLIGNMSVRVADNPQEPGEPHLVQRIVMSPIRYPTPEFGSCFATPASFSLFEHKFSSQGLSLVGPANLLGYALSLSLSSDEAESGFPRGVGCLLFFRRSPSGSDVPVLHPTEANQFILLANYKTKASGSKIITMIGTVSFPAP